LPRGGREKLITCSWKTPGSAGFAHERRRDEGPVVDVPVFAVHVKCFHAQQRRPGGLSVGQADIEADPVGGIGRGLDVGNLGDEIALPALAGDGRDGLRGCACRRRPRIYLGGAVRHRIFGPVHLLGLGEVLGCSRAAEE